MNLDRLEELARCATPGPWEQKNGSDVFGQLGGDSGGGTIANDNDAWQIADCSIGLTYVHDEMWQLTTDRQAANAAYIAAASPDVMLKIVAALRAAQQIVVEVDAGFDASDETVSALRAALEELEGMK